MSMSYMGTSYPGGRGVRSFFDLFTRDTSDAITNRILARFAAYGDFDVGSVDAVSRLRSMHLGLPSCDPTVDSVFLIAAHALFQKNGDMVSEHDPEATALHSFYQSEDSCKAINDAMIERAWGTPDERAILTYASSFIAGVLGNAPSLEDLDFRFGPGINVSRVGTKYTSPNVKLSGTLTFSNSLISKLDQVRATLPRVSLEGPVCGSLEFVPKNFKTHRSIMIEPGVNSGFQLGVGAVLKDRLRARAGIDLTDQSIQRERARLGSLYDTYSTIDLSRASDSISYMLVMNLLPYDWFDLLDSLRTPYCVYRGKFIVLEKFSSMGNGYTFELETLIFKALIHGIAKHYSLGDDSSVYGDDITCSKQLGQLILDLFPSFGFAVNKEKSFTDGPFREACGGDYRLGVDVRPFFLRSNRDGGRWSYQKLFSFHNFLQRKPWFDPDNLIRADIIQLIPDDIALWGPDGFGDGHLVSNAPWGTYLKRSRRRREAQYEGFVFHTWQAAAWSIPQKVHPLLPLYATYGGLSLDSPYDWTIQRVPKDVRIDGVIRRCSTAQKWDA